MNKFLFHTATCLVLAMSVLHPAHVRAQSQSEMNQTAEKEFEAADTQLNKVYAKVLGTLDTTGQEKLKAAQRAWVQFREAETALAADSARGGTMAPLLGAARSTDLTQQRTADFRKMLKGE